MENLSSEVPKSKDMGNVQRLSRQGVENSILEMVPTITYRVIRYTSCVDSVLTLNEGDDIVSTYRENL